MWPDDDYLTAVGRALYAWTYLEWGIVCVLREEGHSSANLSAKTSGQVMGAFANSVEQKPNRADLASRLSALVERRDDMVHSHPATIDGKTRMHRHEMKRRNRLETITPGWLADFEAEVLSATREVNKLLYPD